MAEAEAGRVGQPTVGVKKGIERQTGRTSGGGQEQ